MKKKIDNILDIIVSIVLIFYAIHLYIKKENDFKYHPKNVYYLNEQEIKYLGQDAYNKLVEPYLKEYNNKHTRQE